MRPLVNSTFQDDYPAYFSEDLVQKVRSAENAPAFRAFIVYQSI